MKLLKELELGFEDPLWRINPEFAVIDTILETHSEIDQTLSKEIIGQNKSRPLGRQDRPTVEQIVRAAI